MTTKTGLEQTGQNLRAALGLGGDWTDGDVAFLAIGINALCALMEHRPKFRGPIRAVIRLAKAQGREARAEREGTER